MPVGIGTRQRQAGSLSNCCRQMEIRLAATHRQAGSLSNCCRQTEVRLAVDGLNLRRFADGFQAEAMIGPAGDEPFHVLGDGIDLLDVFLGRVGVVHAQVALAVELAGDAEVEADGLS